MSLHQFICIFSFTFSFLFVKSQNIPEIDFRNPLDIPMYLAGNFGEFRSNHFHMGIDIKTESREGIPIYAIADGYVSRVKVSGHGYGKALYITHQNGYTSVYAHMQKFTKDINNYVERAQYRDKTFEINLFPGPDVFSFKKGDIIGYTGNSGSSAGPHLHFEIRETSSEHPVNPLLFGFDIKDEIKPSIYGIMVYPLDSNAAVNGKKYPQNFAMGGTFGNYVLKNDNTIQTQGDFGIAIHTIDRLTGFPNKCGVYEIKIWENDSNLIYHQKMDELSFDTKRYVNAHMDYKVFKQNRKSYHKCFLLPNNKLKIYQKATNNGVLNIPNGEHRNYHVEVTDAYQNKSVLNFSISGKTFPQVEPLATQEHTLFNFKQDNRYKGSEIDVHIPNGALYENLKFEYSKDSSLPKLYANIHTIHHRYTPLHKNMTVAITPSKEIPFSLKPKAVIVSLDDKNRPSAKGGSWNSAGQLTTKLRDFGRYSIMVDTIAPQIKPLTAIKSRILGNGSEIVFRIKDDLSGINKIEGKVGNNWVLLNYDPKKQKIKYTINTKYIETGSQDFIIKITDAVGNNSVYQTKIMVN